jgi:LacI family transcriptional regulator
MMRKVALLIETDRPYGRGLLSGVARYTRLHGPWSFYVAWGTMQQTMPPLTKWGCEGIIARVDGAAMGKKVAALEVPAIVLGYNAMPGQVRLGTRSENEGVMAAEHLLDRGFRHFAFCGLSEQFSLERQRGFTDRLAGEKHVVHIYQHRRGGQKRWWSGEEGHMAAWLAGLPKPLGVFASNDDLGRRVLEASRAAGIAVPDSVAVLGVDNDEILCNLCNPPLSSIELSVEKAGFEAAAMLDRMMAGQSPECWEIIVEPMGVITRQSTDVLAIDDQDVALAVRFIRENAARPINVSDLLEAIPVARRTLECRFRNVLGRSLHAEILRAHVERAKMLLAATDKPISWVAENAGFATPGYMAEAFYRATGQKPTAYRRRYQSGLMASAENAPFHG